MARHSKVFAFVCFGITFLGSVANNSTIAAVINQYDFEPATGFVTQSGWTHMPWPTAATSTTAGFVLADTTIQYPNVDRGSSTQAPVDVTRDVIHFTNSSDIPNSKMRFQEIVPAYASSVLITIYRSDPSEFFAPAFTTTLALNGGTPSTIDTGISTPGVSYFPPIVATVPITPVGSPGTIDLRFLGSGLRLNGISFEYTIQEVPEPSAFALALCGLCALWRVRRK
jgi:hypothetical protein